MHYYVESWQRYTDFQGRASRPAYWWPALVSFLVSLILSLLVGPLYLIYSLAYLCPSIALGVRRPPRRRTHREVDVASNHWHRCGSSSLLGGATQLAGNK